MAAATHGLETIRHRLFRLLTRHGVLETSLLRVLYVSMTTGNVMDLAKLCGINRVQCKGLMGAKPYPAIVGSQRRGRDLDD
jgi:hypothetical protein